MDKDGRTTSGIKDFLKEVPKFGHRQRDRIDPQNIENQLLLCSRATIYCIVSPQEDLNDGSQSTTAHNNEL